MVAVLTYAITLLIAVLISELAHRSVISTAVLFLAVGFIGAIFGFIPINATYPVVAELAELALVSILFTDGLKIGIRDLTAAWHLPGRALLLGLPLTLAGTALIARWVVHLSWAESLLIGASLSATDPVFAAAVVGSEHVPGRLRQLLNVESGMNDGLALPIVLAVMGWLGVEQVHIHWLLGQIAIGIVIGIVVPIVAVQLERSRFFSAAGIYQPLFGFAVALLVFAICVLIHANEYLGLFAAGITLASISQPFREHFMDFGELLAELFKLAAVLIFGALISPHFLHEIGGSGAVFTVLTILLVRPVALMIALWGSALDWRERITAAWFGPKGFASVVFGLLILKSGLADRERLFHLIAAVVAGSIVVHSSTDVLVSRWFREQASGNPR